MQPGFRNQIRIALLILTAAPALVSASGLPDSCDQLLIAIADDWSDSKGLIQRFERDGRSWRPVSAPAPALFGKKGLAWGIGVTTPQDGAPVKQERDKRAPAGIFALGKIFTHDPQLPEGSDYPYRTITKADAWIDDPNLGELYNQHIVVDPANPPGWFEQQKMRHGDFAYRWLIDIRHNRDQPIPGAGSAIFFHLRRGPDRVTAGCTTLPESELVETIRWLRADKHPHYVLLPAAEYQQNWRSWGLPEPKLLSALKVQ